MRWQLPIGVSLLLAWAVAASAQNDSTTVATVDVAAVADSARLGPDWAWARWPAIDAAIAIEPLDGPQDIMEKEEIIADRLDALSHQQTRLDSITAGWQQRRVALAAQLEVLEDLSDLQLGGDLDLQRRLEALRDDAQQADTRHRQLRRVDGDLRAERARLVQLSRDYESAAQRLREEEEALR